MKTSKSKFKIQMACPTEGRNISSYFEIVLGKFKEHYADKEILL